MTKLTEWLFAAGILIALWFSLLTNKITNNLVTNHYNLLLYSPIIFLGLFGLFALILVLYRVYTFNDCDEAAEELQKEIIQARTDLNRLGFKFKM
ncbi:hypothetical protein ABEB36_006241 [Hypothenemus hampei]|uniref:Dolichol-phosphate mannosyltransferase subunit 3 n=1 Tax=Hypothenemus hampei TaxID=57062 RepID=A0ABD1EQB1_HYPHA